MPLLEFSVRLSREMCYMKIIGDWAVGDIVVFGEGTLKIKSSNNKQEVNAGKSTIVPPSLKLGLA